MISPSTIISLTNLLFSLNKDAHAGVVELVDAEDSKSSGPCALASSSLAFGTKKIKGLADFGQTLLIYSEFFVKMYEELFGFQAVNFFQIQASN